MSMKQLAATVLLWPLATPLFAAPPPPACASLCGEWRLDATASDKPQLLLDVAFREYKEPKIRHPRMPRTDSIEALGKAEDEAALGPILDRPGSHELRRELDHALQQPAALSIGGNADDIHIVREGAPALDISPGETSTRVDSYGTAHIDPRWHGTELTVNEKYDRRNQQETRYSVGRDGALRVTVEIVRRGLPRVIVRSVYRRP